MKQGGTAVNSSFYTKGVFYLKGENMDLKQLLKEYEKFDGKEVIVEGWLRNHRSQKEFGFLDLFDGTAFGSIQIVYTQSETEEFEKISKFRIGSAVEVVGKVVVTPEAKQDFEILASKVILHGSSEEDYPIQPKRHTREFLREKAHLRGRTLLFNTVFRIRNELSHIIHDYFHENGYVHCPSPIITKNDGEGAGETFNVSTLDIKSPPVNDKGEIDYSKDFFAEKTNLTVTGQLEAEIFALSFKKAYTFGPTFRAENSNTKTHASEFWMIEPEMAFTDLDGNMDEIEKFLKHIVKTLLVNCPNEMNWLNQFVEKGLLDKLNEFANSKFHRISYTDAIKILEESGEEFEFEVAWGNDLASEHEKYLSEKHFKSPVFVTDWPKEMKAFYMRLNDDCKTVAGVDLLVPRVGELVGGAQREERYDLLQKRMIENDILDDELWWYLELRKYGGCYHSGYGVGFDRLIMYVTGVENIRDSQPFPRTPRNCEI